MLCDLFQFFYNQITFLCSVAKIHCRTIRTEQVRNSVSDPDLLNSESGNFCWIKIRDQAVAELRSENLIYRRSSQPPKYIQAQEEASSHTGNSLNMKFNNFFIFVTILACQDPDLLTHLNPDPIQFWHTSAKLSRQWGEIRLLNPSYEFPTSNS